MSEIIEEPGRPENTEGDASPAVVCPECQSRSVRPSHSSYPLDQSKVAGRDLAFWRCENCGYRFPGPRSAERKSGRRGRRGSTRNDDSLTKNVKLGRAIKRWLFPVLVIISTVIAVVYILDRRNSRQEQSIVAPD